MNIKTIAKYVDQPIIINSLQRKLPQILTAGAAGFCAYDTIKSKSETRRKNTAVKNTIITLATLGATLIGAKGLTINNRKIIKGLLETKPLSEIIEAQTAAVKKYTENVQLDDKLKKILEKAQNNKLNIKEIKVILEELPEGEKKKELIKVILPEPENLNSAEIFSEIKRLSLLGLIPIAGGISGGIIADRICKCNTKKSTGNKIKEGFYQYFANIFLCNVGAGTALYTSEKLQKLKLIKPLTPLKKLAVILSGITLTGIIGGSFIANYLSKKIIDPILTPKNKPDKRELYSERKPEILDIALHIDDIATAGVLSGFKWIEPLLPLMYFISGYRAGTGYRNGKKE